MSNKQIENNVVKKKFETKNAQITIDLLADEVLATLEITAVVPNNLVEKVLAEKETITIRSYTKFDFSKYLQIAVVFAAAICIGIVMGKNANIDSFNKKQNQKERALIELRERHHLSDSDAFGKL